MYSNYYNFVGTVTLAVIFLLAAPTSTIAQEANLEGLPPQPTQVVMADDAAENVVQAADVTVVMDSPKVEEPTTPLNDLQPEPDISEVAAAPYQETMPKTIPHSGTYYDSESIGPSSLGVSAGPRKVDPLYEPGSSFVIVRKNASSSSKQATIVAAQRALKLKRYAAALELYEKLYKKNKKDKQVLMGLAVAQQYNGFTESAIATYEELLKRDSGNSGAMLNLMGLLEKRSPEVALRKLEKLWSRNSQNPTVAAQLGLMNAKVGDFESSSKYLGIAASLEPSNPQHYYNLAVVMDQAKSHKTAIEYYQKALERDAGAGALPRDEIYDRLAQLRRL